MELEYVLIRSNIHIRASSTLFLVLVLLLQLKLFLFFLISFGFLHFKFPLISLLLSELYEPCRLRSANVIHSKHEAISLADFGQDP